MELCILTQFARYSLYVRTPRKQEYKKQEIKMSYHRAGPVAPGVAFITGELNWRLKPDTRL